jgi:hypothetical protein
MHLPGQHVPHRHQELARNSHNRLGASEPRFQARQCGWLRAALAAASTVLAYVSTEAANP